MRSERIRHICVDLSVFILSLWLLLSNFCISASAAQEAENSVPIVGTTDYVTVEGADDSSTVGGYDDSSVSGSGSIYTINNADDLAKLSELCQDYSWSVGKTVNLTSDVDLSGISFTPIPCFSGEFCGNQHTISNVNIIADGDRVGLFAVLTVDAVVSELRVTGSVATDGNGIVGGIAGENSGTIQNCIFQGTVDAPYSAGGIAGINFETGIICDSKISGTITGKLCSGGVTAENMGQIKSCENYAEVSNGVSALTAWLEPELLKGSICGTSSGTIENCKDCSSQVQNSDSTLFPVKIDRNLLLFAGCVVLVVNILGALLSLVFCRSRKY